MSLADQLEFETFAEWADVAHIADRPIAELISEIQTLYQMDSRPWVVGFSGGKDSTVILQLIYQSIENLSPDERTKPVFVISSDTLVETPMVADLISGTLDEINRAAKKRDLPITGDIVYPKTSQSFWVNLLGKGYPAPTTKFRWCTERMKIDPVSAFIQSKISNFGEVIVVLGARSQESATRAHTMKKHRIDGSLLSRHTSLANAYIYTPIANWRHDDVWECLLSASRPWGGTNETLFDLYKGSNQGECPLVIDTNTPSCGNSRFGCWVCTVVKKERAIEGLISSGETWLKPLQDFRNLLAETTEPENKSTYRNFKRRTGRVSYVRGPIDKDGKSAVKHVPGPYWMKYRQQFLRKLLGIQRDLQAAGRDIELITEPELHEIRKEWIHDPNEPDWQDTLPKIYNEIIGADLAWVENDVGAFTDSDIELLKRLEAKHNVPAEMIMKLLEVELSMDGLSRRRGLTDRINSLLTRDWIDENNFEENRTIVEANMGFEERLEEIEKEYEFVKKQQIEYPAH